MRRRRRKISFSPDPRRTALKRAGFAVLAALLLLLGVLWYGDSDEPTDPAFQPPVQSSASSEASTSASSDATGVPAMSDAPMPVEIPAETAKTETTAETVAETTVPLQAAAPEKSAVLPEAPLPESVPAAAPESVPAPAAAPQVLPDGYFVQLGVFDATDNASRLFDNAKALGLPAHIQTRVVVGPFRNQREAEAAQKHLEELAEGIVIPPRDIAKADKKPSKRSAKSRRAKR